MRLKIILTGIGLALLALIALAFTVLMATDFNDYRDLVQQRMKAATGRDLVIAGNIDASFSLSPRLSAKQVSFRNAAWSDIPQMASLNEIEAEIALLPLLSGEIRINEVVLRGGQVVIETNKEGVGNWVLDLAPQTGACARGIRHHRQRPAEDRPHDHRGCDAAPSRRRDRRAAHPRDQALHRRGRARRRHQGRDQGRVERAAAGARRHRRRAAAVHRRSVAAQPAGQAGRGRARPARPDRRSHHLFRSVAGRDQLRPVARGPGRPLRHRVARTPRPIRSRPASTAAVASSPSPTPTQRSAVRMPPATSCSTPQARSPG